MDRRIITLIISLAAQTLTEAVAQQPLPHAADQPSWGVRKYVLGLGFDNSLVQSVGVIDVCGVSYNTVIGIDTGNEVYYRNEGQRTWLRNSTDCDEREYLLYDLTLNEGDTTYVGWQMEGPTLDTTLVIVQSIDIVNYEGVPRRRFSLLVDRCPNTFGPSVFTEDVWVEGVGSLRHPFYSTLCICDFCETDFSLLCADSAGVATYRHTSGIVCDQTIDITDKLSGKQRFNVHYSAGQLRLEVPHDIMQGVITIHDMKGSTVFSTKVGTAATSIDARRFPAGVYTVALSTPDQLLSTRCLITE